MKIRKQIIKKKIISEQQFAATAQEEAEKINAQTGAGYVTDQSFWENQGVVSGEDLALSVLGQTYSDYYKEVHGFRPKHGTYTSVEEYTAAINDLDEYYTSLAEEEALDAQRHAAIEKERQELEDLMPGAFDFQSLAKQSGMGRRMENRILKLAPQTLRQIIREEYKNHVDGHPFPGPLEDLAKLHGKPWGHGAVVDPDGWKKAVKLGGQYTKGTAPSPLKKNKMKLSERQLRRIVRASLSEVGQLNIPLGDDTAGEE